MDHQSGAGQVTGERIRDKIATSKRKGFWMGGNPPLGYDTRDKQLIVNEVEAETVRHIYRRYLALGSVRLLKDELDLNGIVSKRRIDRYGRQSGGKSLSRGALHLMLQNRICRGEIVHKDMSHPGQHEAIVEEPLWDAVQAKLAKSRVERDTSDNERVTTPSLLTGLVFDDDGERMTPSHANKKGRRYRYYVSRSLVTGDRRSNPRGRRVPASDLERLVEDRVMRLLGNVGELHDVLATLLPDAAAQARLLERAAVLGNEWQALPADEKRRTIRRIVARVDLMLETLEIRVRPARLIDVLGEGDEIGNTMILNDDDAVPTLTLSIPARLRRTGMEKRLLIEGVGLGSQGKVKPNLVKLIAKAQELQAVFLRGNASIQEMATAAGMTSSYFTRILRLSFLAPEICKAVLQGRQPIGLNARKLMADTRLPLRWNEQRALLGFD